MGIRILTSGVAVALMLAGVARADDAPATTDAAKVAALRSRVVEWLEARKKLDLEKCTKCDGLRYRYDPRTRAYTPCPGCEAHGRQIPKERFLKVYAELRSPAWRALETSAKDLEAAYAATRYQRDQGFLRRFRVDRVVLVGPQQGVAFVAIDSEKAPRETRWIATSASAAMPADWFLYTPVVDGPWPENASAILASAQATALPDDQMDALRSKLIVGRRSPFALEEARTEGATLVLSLFNGSAKNAEDLDGAIIAALMGFTSDSLDAQPGVDGVRLSFVTRYRDKFGRVSKAAYRTCEISREDFGKIQIENLTPARDLPGLFHATNAAPPEESIPWWQG